MAINWIVGVNIFLEVAAMFLEGFTLAYDKFHVNRIEDPILFGSIVLFAFVSIVWFIYFMKTSGTIELIVQVLRILQSFMLLAMGTLIIYFATQVEKSESCKYFDKDVYGACQQFIIKLVAGGILLLDALLYLFPPPKMRGHAASSKAEPSDGSFWQMPVIAIPRARIMDLRDKIRGNTPVSPVSSLIVSGNNGVGYNDNITGGGQTSASNQPPAPPVPGPSRAAYSQYPPGAQQVLPMNASPPPIPAHPNQGSGMPSQKMFYRIPESQSRPFTHVPTSPSIHSMGSMGEANFGFQQDHSDPTGFQYHHQPATAINHHVMHDPRMENENSNHDPGFGY